MERAEVAITWPSVCLPYSLYVVYAVFAVVCAVCAVDCAVFAVVCAVFAVIKAFDTSFAVVGYIYESEILYHG